MSCLDCPRWKKPDIILYQSIILPHGHNKLMLLAITLTFNVGSSTCGLGPQWGGAHGNLSDPVQVTAWIRANNASALSKLSY